MGGEAVYCRFSSVRLNYIKNAEELSYEDFRTLEETGEVPEETRDWVIENHFRYYDNPVEDLYFEGWVEGALHFWNEIKDQL